MNDSAPTYAKKDDPRAIAWLKRYDQMKSERAPWESEWQEIGDYMQPEKVGITSISDTPDRAKSARLFDTSAMDAAIQCAAGLTSWRTPANSQWFAWNPPMQMRGSDAVAQWLQNCSEEGRGYLAKSNFYSETHEDMLGHCTFNTSALFTTLQGGQTVFKALAIGTYCIAENYLGMVDTLYREFTLTARQAKQQFGTDRLGRDVPLPECIENCLKGDAKDEDKKFTFIHVVEPRAPKDRGDGVGLVPDWRKPIASVYIEKESKAIVQESGFDSFPYMVGRWRKRSFGGSESVWGWGPGFQALPDARQINFLRKMMAVYAEKSAFPPMFVPDSLEGELNMSARAVNYTDPSINPQSIFAVPVTGDYKLAMESADYLKRSIENKFHVPFFLLFQSIDPKITATLTRELAAERFKSISPALTRLISEKDTPMLMRLFSMWAQAGMLPPPPEEAIVESSKSGFSVPDPEIAYTSQLALAEKAMQNLSFDRTFDRIMAVAKIEPRVLRNYNWKTLARGTSRNDGMPAEWLNSLEEVAAMEEQDAAMQQAQAQMQLAEQGSKAAANVAKAGPELAALIGA